MMKTMHTAQEPIPLWRQLQATAAVIGAVRNGSSGTAAVEAVAAPLRPGVQALAFHVWRNLGRAEALRSRLVSRMPAPATDALLCVALALAWNEETAPYDAFTLVNQAVEALKRNFSTAPHANFVNACLRRFLRERVALVAATDHHGIKLRAAAVCQCDAPAPCSHRRNLRYARTKADVRRDTEFFCVSL